MSNFDDKKSKILQFHVEHAGVSLEEANLRWEGLEKFLALCAETDKRQVASEPVDALWHDFLLFTEGYKEYCLEKFGKFIHHLPATTVPPSGYFDSRALLENKYGSLNMTAWPVMERADWSVGYTKPE